MNTTPRAVKLLPENEHGISICDRILPVITPEPINGMSVWQYEAVEPADSLRDGLHSGNSLESMRHLSPDERHRLERTLRDLLPELVEAAPFARITDEVTP